jgi:hypothetical protein
MHSILTALNRPRLIGAWFALVGLSGAAALSLGPIPTVTTVGMLFALAVTPPAIVMILWPGVQPLTAAEVIRGERRMP